MVEVSDVQENGSGASAESLLKSDENNPSQSVGQKLYFLSPLMVNKDSQFLDDLQIRSTSALDRFDARTLCPICKKSRMFYCYSCYIPVPEIKHLVPKVKLPVKIDIIKHPYEIDGKSTACHAVMISPNDIKIHIFPEIPNYKDKNVS
ncbi:DTW domain-containing protein 1 [Nymphon striatum]|nr:DTW domain-containing protein 1 [Nymphon striatum]